jgi:hypothetical protein
VEVGLVAVEVLVDLRERQAVVVAEEDELRLGFGSRPAVDCPVETNDVVEGEVDGDAASLGDARARGTAGAASGRCL